MSTSGAAAGERSSTRVQVRKARGREGGAEAGRELWASPEWSSFTRDDMVLVMESAATSRSLRRFLLVPEGSQSRRRGRVRPPRPRPPPSSLPEQRDPVGCALPGRSPETWIPEPTALGGWAGGPRGRTGLCGAPRASSVSAQRTLARPPRPPRLRDTAAAGLVTRVAARSCGQSHSISFYTLSGFPGKARLRELFHPIPPEQAAKPKRQVTSPKTRWGKRARKPRRPGLHKHRACSTRRRDSSPSDDKGPAPDSTSSVKV